MIYFIGVDKIDNTVEADFGQLINWLKNKNVIFIDSETTWEDDLHLKKMLSFQVGDAKDQWIIDTRYYNLEPLRKILESKKVLKVGHNIKFDASIILIQYGIRLNNVCDTMVNEYILNTGLTQKKGFYTLQSTHYRYTGIDPYGEQLSIFDPYIPKKTRTQISKKLEGPFDYSEVFYMKMDVEALARLFPHQIKRLQEEKLEKVADLENKFVLVLVEMEVNGMPLDTSRWVELYDWAMDKKEKKLAQLKSIHPDVLNWNSQLQVARKFKELGIPIQVKDKKTGRLKDSVQELVIKEHEDKFPIIKDYLLYKKYEKLSGTYGIDFLSHVSNVTGRVHSSFQQIKNTGRTSSTNPNLQNVVSEKDGFEEGKWWREAFSTKKGYTFVIADYSSQELHVLAHLAQEEKMLNVLRDRGDIHSLTGTMVFKVEVSQHKNKALRKRAKILNFGIAYGMGADKLHKDFKVSIKEAEKIIKSFYEAYPTLKKYFDLGYQKAINRGYILVDKLGRKSYIQEIEKFRTLERLKDLGLPELKKQLRTISGKIQRTSQNYVIQGTAASMSKYAGILLREAMLETKLFKIILLIHDEWVVECRVEDAEKVKEIVEQCMGKAADFFCTSVHVPAEAIITSKWNK